MENNQELTSEQKEKVLKDTSEYTENLKKLEKMQESMQDGKESEGEKERYDILKERDKIKKDKNKSMEVNRRIGFHRRYLYPYVKISNYILLVIFIILSILVTAKFLPSPTEVSRGDTNIVASSSQSFGNKVEMDAKSSQEKNILSIQVMIYNGEGETIYFNPETIKLRQGETIYMPHINDEDKEKLSNSGLNIDEKVSFTLEYEIDENTAKNATLETIIKGDKETCILITSIGY